MTDGPGHTTTYVHRVLDLFAEFGDREALVGADRRLTYTEAAARVRAMAATLTGTAYGPGRRCW